MILNSKNNYGSVSISFHWLMAALLIFIMFIGQLFDAVPKDYKTTLVLIHSSLGLIIFPLAILRLVWRLINVTPEKINTSAMLNKISNIVFIIFYTTMLLLPLSGYFLMNIKGQTVSFFGYDLINLFAPNTSLGRLPHQIHGLTADILLFTFFLHFLAAMYHHFLKKDRTLKRITNLKD